MKTLLNVALLLLCFTTATAQDTPADEAFSDGLFGLIMGKGAEAETNFDKAIELGHTDLAKCYRMRGKAKMQQQKYPDALKDLTKAEDVAGLTADIAYERAGCYFGLDENTEALKWYNELEKLDPTWSELPQMRGMVYIELKEYDKAIADLDVAIARKPKDKQLYQFRGNAYLLSYRDDQACANYRMAEKLGNTRVHKVITEYCGNVAIPDSLKPADTDWKPYQNPQVITAENAKSITTFDKSDVESMVTYFYASKIRGDDDWKKVLEPENTWSRRMLYSLEKYENWTFTEFRLDKKKMHSQDRWWINIHFEIEVNGQTDGGFDEVSVTNNNGTWMITEVPN